MGDPRMTTATGQMDAVSIYASAMDESVNEVFALMMGIACEPCADCPVSGAGTISAVIGLAGAMSGACMVSSGEEAALRMAGALMGLEVSALDDTVRDAIGEICNMVAGAWKGKIPELASSCMLSTPTVVTGTSYQLHVQRPEARIERCYRFEDMAFSLTLICESMR